MLIFYETSWSVRSCSQHRLLSHKYLCSFIKDPLLIKSGSLHLSLHLKFPPCKTLRVFFLLWFFFFGGGELTLGKYYFITASLSLSPFLIHNSNLRKVDTKIKYRTKTQRETSSWIAWKKHSVKNSHLIVAIVLYWFSVKQEEKESGECRKIKHILS